MTAQFLSVYIRHGYLNRILFTLPDIQVSHAFVLVGIYDLKHKVFQDALCGVLPSACLGN